MSCCFLPNPTKLNREYKEECKANPASCSMMAISLLAFTVISLMLIASFFGLALPPATYWGLAGACVGTFVLTVICATIASRPPGYVHKYI